MARSNHAYTAPREQNNARNGRWSRRLTCYNLFILFSLFCVAYVLYGLLGPESQTLVDLKKENAKINKCIQKYKTDNEKHMIPYHLETGRPVGSNDDEDQIIYKTFFENNKKLKKGTYLELGAFDGIEASNTLLFQYCLSWSGVLIEPGLNTFKNLEKNRPDNILYNRAVGCEGTVKFFDHGWRITKMEPSKDESANSIVGCIGLQDIFDEHLITHIDFFSLDVEGWETKVLETINFQKISFDVLLIENLHSQQSRKFMDDNLAELYERVSVDNLKLKTPRSDVYLRKASKTYENFHQ